MERIFRVSPSSQSIETTVVGKPLYPSGRRDRTFDHQRVPVSLDRSCDRLSIRPSSSYDRQTEDRWRTASGPVCSCYLRTILLRRPLGRPFDRSADRIRSFDRSWDRVEGCSWTAICPERSVRSASDRWSASRVFLCNRVETRYQRMACPCSCRSYYRYSLTPLAQPSFR